MGLASISSGMVWHLTGPGGSAGERNQHLSALRGFFDRMVQRHVVLLDPAASVLGVKETVVEGKTPEVTHRPGPKADGVGQGHVHGESKRAAGPGSCERRGPAGPSHPGDAGLYRLPGRRDREATAARFPARRRAAPAAGSRKGRQAREIPVRLELQRDILAYHAAAGIGVGAEDRPPFRSTVRKTKQLTGNGPTSKAICEMVRRRLKAANCRSGCHRIRFA